MSPTGQAGVSLVEVLISTVIGVVVAGGAGVLFLNHVKAQTLEAAKADAFNQMASVADRLKRDVAASDGGYLGSLASQTDFYTTNTDSSWCVGPTVQLPAACNVAPPTNETGLAWTMTRNKGGAMRQNPGTIVQNAYFMSCDTASTKLAYVDFSAFGCGASGEAYFQRCGAGQVSTIHLDSWDRSTGTFIKNTAASRVWPSDLYSGAQASQAIAMTICFSILGAGNKEFEAVIRSAVLPANLTTPVIYEMDVPLQFGITQSITGSAMQFN